MAEFAWDVFLPGEDLPHRLTTDYIIGAGEHVTVDGRAWLVEHVEIDETIEGATGTVAVVAAVEPTA